jgi:bacterial/archaeal transporter family-2 protein
MLAAVSAGAFAVGFSLVAGLAGAAQVAISGALGRRIGVLDAAAFGGIVAAVILVAIAIVFRTGDGITSAFREPPWLWLGGLMGAVVVAAITYSPERIGVFATIGLLITGQLALGAVIDATGMFGVERIPLNVTRVVGLVLLSAGAVLVLKR